MDSDISYEPLQLLEDNTSDIVDSGVKSSNDSGGFFNNDYDTDYEYMYLLQGFSFERPIYLYVWTVLCGIVVISNVIILATVCKSSLRSSTTIVLASIAIADTLVMFVTVPTFQYTYSQFEPGINGAHDVFVLSKQWCKAFMISRLYLSQVFTTASLWLHCLLGFQRFFSVWFPLRSHMVITHARTIFGTCMLFLFAGIIHVYHLLDEKADENYMCVWHLEQECSFGCAYMWYTLFLVHLFPSTILTIFTGMLIYKLFQTAKEIQEMKLYSGSSTAERRNTYNRNVTKVVVAVLICLLIPEIPHCVLLTVNVALRHAGKDVLPLKANRALQTSYELLLACSYCANFWIYAFLNKSFQKELKKLFCCFFGRTIPRYSQTGISQRSVLTLVVKSHNTPEPSVSEKFL